MHNFLKIILIMIAAFLSVVSLADVNPKRLLLSELRNGDYAHAGDAEAIEIVMHKVLELNPHLESGKIIDIGCGFGGTLDYMKHMGFQHLYGIDLDKTTIDYAKAKYHDIDFEVADALSMDPYFQGKKFDFITFFNAIYAIKDKRKLLSEMANIATPDAIIAIFDYAAQDCHSSLSVLDFAGKPMMPVCLNQLKLDLASTGWEFIESQDLSREFIAWYSDFLTNLSNQKKSLEKRFTQETINSVRDTFVYFLNELRSGKLGGIVVYARKR